MNLEQVITSMLDDMLQRRQFGVKWAVTKDHIAEIAKIRTKTLPSHRDIAKAVKALPYRFLMKTPAGYCFPANGREWKAYVERREKQARGLLHEAIDQSGFNYDDFKNSLNGL